MENATFRLPLYLPAQGAAESEATIVEWRVAEGDCFQKGQVLGQIDSAKSVFDFEAPCDGRLVRLLCAGGETVAYDKPVMEIETSDPAMKESIPPAAASPEPAAESTPRESFARELAIDGPGTRQVVLRSLGGYLPKRVVTNAEILERFPDISEDYVYQVTGIRERRWAEDGEKPSDMAYAASLEAIRKAELATSEIDGVILATTTPDVAMPSTACILQARLGLGPVPAFDLNAACSGWLYALAMARNMVLSGMARNILTVGVDVQSRLLHQDDQATSFIFGDGAGAAIVSAEGSGHRIGQVVLGADARGLRMARRQQAGYFVANGHDGSDPWIRLDGQALFRFATESFANIIRETIVRTGWAPEETRWVVPHQANQRIIKAAAKRSGVPFDRFFLNVDRVGNTSSASIVLALLEMEQSLAAGDKLILCSVGAGITTAAASVEW
jgi:3-oxoacyl-[acyl-carrier-protein] synthase-3